MNTAFDLIVILFLIGVNAFFAAAEIALVSANPVRMRLLAEDGNRAARRVLVAMDDSTRFLATIQVGITLAGFFTSATAATNLSAPVAAALKPSLGKAADTLAFISVTIAIAFLSLILGELVPKRLGLRNAEAIALTSIQPIRWLGKLTAPIVRFLSTCTNLILRLTGNSLTDDEEEVSIEEIKVMVDAARAGGSVGEQERRIIHGAVELSNVTTRAIMVPRVNIEYLKTNATLEAAYQMASENAHTRLPVCEGDLDHIVGILHVKDLIRPLAELREHPPAISELVRPVYEVPETKPVRDLLAEMKENRLHLVIVKDEFGGTAGLVTLEDVLEEIVGEIRDEYDAEEEREFRRTGKHEGIFKIRASIATVNNELNIELPRDAAATLAGLFLEELQRPPNTNDSLEIEGVKLTVLEDGQRVQISRLSGPPP
jgi:putative hemolysin